MLASEKSTAVAGDPTSTNALNNTNINSLYLLSNNE